LRKLGREFGAIAYAVPRRGRPYRSAGLAEIARLMAGEIDSPALQAAWPVLFPGAKKASRSFNMSGFHLDAEKKP
jgi:hypothetical protein